MASKSEIANLAVAHLGIGKEILDVETDQSEEAAIFRRFYDIARQATLNELNWSFARKEVALGLVEENPTTEWQYSYRYPVDCLYVRRIKSGDRYDSRAGRESFDITKDIAGKLIYADLASASIEYTENLTDTSLFPAQFVLALSYRCAYYMANNLTAGDPFKIKQDIFREYSLELSRAKEQNMNESRLDERSVTEFITTRE